MKKTILSVIGASLFFCCGAAETYDSVMKTGNAAFSKKNYAAAAEAFQKAEPLAKSSYQKATCIGSLAHCLARQGKYNEAVALFQSIEKIKGVPPFCISFAYYDLGGYAEKLKKTDDALKFYLLGSKVAKDCDRPFDCMLKAGAILTKQKKYQEAVQVYVACKDAKDSTRTVNGYVEASGVYKWYLRDSDSALKMLAEAEKVSDKMKQNDYKLKVIYTRAHFFRDAKKYDEAFKEFMRVETVKNPQRDWAAALYCGAAVIAFENKKDVKLAKELMAKSVACKSSWGTSRHYQKLIEAAK